MDSLRQLIDIFLHLDGSDVHLPVPGTEIRVAEEEGVEGRKVGFVTTSVRHHELGPVARDGNVDAVFSESLRTHDVLSRAFAQAVKESPNGAGGDLARRAIEIASSELHFRLNPDLGGFPSGFLRRLRARSPSEGSAS